MIARTLSKQILKTAKQYPVIGVVGPRQSGKTTLVQSLFPKYKYVNLESLQDRQFALSDPKGFLKTYTGSTIIDEIQRAPNLLSELQVYVDKNQKAGSFVITGSQHFLLMESISQSLAGRIALHTLLPLSYGELEKANIVYPNIHLYLFTGGYPKLHDKKIDVTTWYANYMQTYIERDVRSLKQVSDLLSFQYFVKLCAGRTGQILNLSSLAVDAGISHNTAKAWLSVLETSFVIFLLRPHHRNYNKRLIKSPKLYFVDTGLASWLLGMTNAKQLATHFQIGGLFENWVISEYIKYQYNHGLTINAYYWRDNIGHEIDLLVEQSADTLIPIEIKAGATVQQDMFTRLEYWQQIAQTSQRGYLVYGGSSEQRRSTATVVPWHNTQNLFHSITRPKELREK